MNDFSMPRGDTRTIRGHYPDVETLSDYSYVLHIDDAIDGTPLHEITGTDLDEENKYVYFVITEAISKTMTKQKYYCQAKRYDADKTLIKSTPDEPVTIYMKRPLKIL